MVKDVNADGGESTDLLRYGIAFRILRHWLGRDWTERNVTLSSTPDPFFKNALNSPNSDRLTHMIRVEFLAEAIFVLRSSNNFENLLERLRGKNARAAFFDADIAARVVERGCAVSFVVPTGRRGCDYDFVAECDGQPISVEVTEKDDVPISVATISNTLNGKRDQFPSTQPAVLYVVLPDAWGNNLSAALKACADAAGRFFQSSQRINAVSFVLTLSYPHSDTGRVYFSTVHPNWSARPRFKVDVSEVVGASGQSVDMTSLATTSGVEAVTLAGRNGERAFMRVPCLADTIAPLGAVPLSA